MILFLITLVIAIVTLSLLIYKWIEVNTLERKAVFHRSQGETEASLALFTSETQRPREKYPQKEIDIAKQIFEQVKNAEPDHCPFEIPEQNINQKNAVRGIVTCAGGSTYLTCFLVQLAMLREVGCKLPVEIWHLPNELQDHQCRRALTENYGDVRLRNLSTVQNQAGWNGQGKFTVKILSIAFSSFEEVLFLDADNNCLKDPTFLFDSAEFLDRGAIFWPDYWKLETQAPIFHAFKGKPWYYFAQESGQILVNKRKCWKGLWACLQLHTKLYEHFTKMLPFPDNWGDKDTFHTSFLGTGTDFHMIPFPTSSVGYFDEQGQYRGTTMGQKDPSGQMLFLHLNALKWDAVEVYPGWEIVFQSGVDDSSSWVDRRSHEIFGKTATRHSFVRLFGNYEARCWKHLETIKSTPWYQRLFRNQTPLIRLINVDITTTKPVTSQSHSESTDSFLNTSPSKHVRFDAFSVDEDDDDDYETL